MKTKLLVLFVAAILVLAGFSIWGFPGSGSSVPADQLVDGIEVTMYKNPGCECCDMWATYMEERGYVVTVHEAADIYTLKEENGITSNVASCHTAFIGDYVIEGHVPAEDIERLLEEKPDAVGLAAPGMPPSSPGMNTIPNVPYDVVLVGHDGSSTVFAQH